MLVASVGRRDKQRGDHQDVPGELRIIFSLESLGDRPIGESFDSFARMQNPAARSCRIKFLLLRPFRQGDEAGNHFALAEALRDFDARASAGAGDFNADRHIVTDDQPSIWRLIVERETDLRAGIAGCNQELLDGQDLVPLLLPGSLALAESLHGRLRHRTGAEIVEQRAQLLYGDPVISRYGI